MSRKAKSWQSVLAGVLWVIAAPWLATALPALEQNLKPMDGQEKVVAFVTFKVETADGQWMRFAVQEHRAAVLEILSTGERYSLTPVLGSGPDELNMEVTRLDGDGTPSGQPVERLNAKVGFPSYLADTSLQQIDIERIDMKVAPTPTGLPQAPIFGPEIQIGSEFDFTNQCCITCGGISGCGCYVGASCGFCCDCCGPQAP